MIDIAFAIVLLIACIKGVRKGLVMAVFSVIAFVIGLVAAMKLSAVAAVYLGEHVSVSAKWLPVLSFALVLLATVLIINWSGKLLEKSFEMVLLGWANKMAGAVLYAVLYSVIFSILLYYSEKLGLLNANTIGESSSYGYIQPLAPAIIGSISKLIPFIGDSFSSLDRFFEGVSDKLKR